MREGKTHVFKASSTIKGDSRFIISESTDCHRDKDTWIIRMNGVDIPSVITGVDLVSSYSLSINFILNLSLLKCSSLSLIVASEVLGRWVNRLDHFEISFGREIRNLGCSEMPFLDLLGCF